MNTAIDSYYDLPAPTVLATSYYIDPNQFAAPDVKSDQAAFDDGVDCSIETEAEARSIAQRLANFLSAPVTVDVFETKANGDEAPRDDGFTVMPSTVQGRA